MRILVVDDDRFLGEFVARELSDRQHEATYVQSPLRALAAAMQQRYDMMLCDLVMPGMSGTHVIRSVRQRLPNLPIVVLSSLDSEVWAPKSIAAGATKYLQKPISVDDLVREVELIDGARVRLNIGLIDDDTAHRARVVVELEALGCRVRAWASLPEMVRQMPHGPEGLSLILVDAGSPDVVTVLGWSKGFRVPAVVFGAPGSYEEENMLRLGASLCLAKPVDGKGLITQARFFTS